jgi:hypothetical protein
MAELRLAIQPAAGEDALSVSICKRRGGWPVPDLHVPLGTSRRPAELKAQLTLWRQWRSAEQPRQANRIGPFPMQSPEPGDADRRVTH